MNRIIHELMGKGCYHDWRYMMSEHRVVCNNCFVGQSDKNLNPTYADSQGRMDYTVMDWMIENLPEVWENYCDLCINVGNPQFSGDVREVLSLSNLLTYLRDHDGWAWMECPENCSGDDYLLKPHWCNIECTGKILNPKYGRAWEMLKEWEND